VWHQSYFSKIYVDFIDIACAGALNPMFGLQGYVTELLFTVRALLIDRSLGNSELEFFFVICIKPKQVVLIINHCSWIRKLILPNSYHTS
jgi:hypothetical protein